MFKRILSESFFLVFHNLGTVFKVCGAWFALQSVFTILLLIYFQGGPTLDQIAENPLIIVVNIVFALVSFSSIAVAWHRFALLGEQPSLIHFKFGMIELRFLGKSLLIFLIVFTATFAVSFTVGALGGLVKVVSGTANTTNFGEILGALTGFILTIFLFRLCIALPATAIERPLAIKQAWALAQGLGWRMIAVMICLISPIALLGVAIDLLAIYSAGGVVDLGMQIKSQILNLLLRIIITVLGITIISSAYRVAMERRAAMEGL